MKSLGKERSSTGVVKGWKVHYLPGRALKGRSVQGVQTDAHEAGSSAVPCACSALPWEFVLDRLDTFPFMPAREGCACQCVCCLWRW